MASTSTQGASSSSTPAPQWNFEVFLSFRGEDTRKSFTDHLYAALERKGIITFRDDEKLVRGEPIPQELLKAIEKSKFAIVIFSRNYASSTWCLDELTKIVRCMKEMGMTVLPVFYDVDPSDVRKQIGTFEKAFAEHDFKENIEKVKTWREALREVANISGWHLQDRHESEFIQQIVEMILHKLSSSFSSITNGLVGIDSLVEQLIPSYLGFGNNVCMIGICGMGGLGKTTLARVVYDKFRSYFEGSSFIANVREDSEKHGLTRLQRQLLVEILEERNIEIWNDIDGADMIRKRLCHKKVIIVLDDVDKLNQLQNLVGKHDWFGLGSWIIITTRDKRLLVQHEVRKIYNPSPLCSCDAQKLFCLNAFKNEQPEEGYMQLSRDVVKLANGLPLALVVLGSFLVGSKMDEWQSALDKFKENPNGDIVDILKISYDGLDEMNRKIFLDIACFFRGWREDRVIKILENCDFRAKIGIRDLREKSLITIENEVLQMHDLLQEMGREIVHRESHGELGKRGRLYLCKDLFDVLTKDTATEAIQAIVLNPHGKGGCWNFEAFPKPFSKMCKLRLLIIDEVHIHPSGLDHVFNDLRFLEWSEFDSKCLPSGFQSDELVELNLQYSQIEYLWEGVKSLPKLKCIDLEGCDRLVRTPDFTGVPRLERIYLSECTELFEIHPSIGQLSELKVLDLRGCGWLQSLPKLPSTVRDINLSKCKKLVEIHLSIGQLSELEVLDLRGCLGLQSLPKLPSTVRDINLSKCKNLVEIHPSIGQLSKLEVLNLRGCLRLQSLPKLPSTVRDINLSECTNLVEIHTSIGQLSELEVLDLRGCGRLQSLPKLPSTVRYINVERCTSLEPSPNCSVAFTILNRYLEGRLSLKAGHETCAKRKEDGSGAEFQIIYSANEIPQWRWLTHQSKEFSISRFMELGLFAHQSEENSVSIELPPNCRWMGLALCVCWKAGTVSLFYAPPSSVTVDLMVHETAVGRCTFKVSFSHPFHIWLLYLSRDTWFATVRNGECSQIRVSFKINEVGMIVPKCGARLVYEQDVEEFNQTIAQCESSHID